jgi:hypothetical protein
MVFRKSPASKGGKEWLMLHDMSQFLENVTNKIITSKSTQSILIKSSEATRNTATAMKYFTK